MKKLKMDHQLAQAVVRGEKTSTWRVFDDKDLTVNDEVALIDKVEADRPATWRVVGTLHIRKVVQKHFSEIRDEDYVGHGGYGSQQAMLDHFREYYGDRVTLDTPVKIVHFDFAPGVPADVIADDPSAVSAARPAAGVQRVILYADGGSRGNPGPSACGYVLLDPEENVLVDKGLYLGITTNNQAEYQGLKQGLEEARAMGAKEVDVRLDSMLVINQMKGVFKVKNRELWPIHDAAKQLVAGLQRVTFTHVPRELNRLADAAANRAMDEAASVRQR